MSSLAVAQMFTIASILSRSLAADSVTTSQHDCLHRPCMIDRSCPSLLEKIPMLCGPTDNQHCFSRNQQECRESLVRLKSAPELQSSCYCQNPSSRSCQDYYNLLYNHPCLRHPASGPIYPQSAQPYNFDLEFAGQLLMSKHILLSCTSALHACRKSPLCRRVYDEFRRRCKVKDNRCRMTNAALCYNSYELIKLTPLWKCICDRPSEKRCLRIQKSIVGNPCIGGFPHLYDVDDHEEDWNATESSTPRRATTPRARVVRPPRPRTTARPMSSVESPASPTVAPDVDTEDNHSEEPPIDETPDETSESPAAAEVYSGPFPGPNETYVLIPQMAASLMFPIAWKIKLDFVEHHGLVTAPPPTTATSEEVAVTAAGEEGATETAALNGNEPVDENSAEPDESVTETSTVATVPPPPVRGQARTTTTARTSARTTSATPSVHGISSTSSAMTTTRRTLPLGRRTTTTTARPSVSVSVTPVRMQVTSKPSATSPIIVPVTTVSIPSGEEHAVVSASTAEGDYNGNEYTGGTIDSGEPEITTEAAVIDDSAPDLRSLPSSICWNWINQYRENSDFDAAVGEFHDTCRWLTSDNDTVTGSCHATGCRYAEARIKRWMGAYYSFCRNLSCENSVPECDELVQLLTPGCVNHALYKPDAETEPWTVCRGYNITLRVRPNTSKRVFYRSECTNIRPCTDYTRMCTCGRDKNVQCTELPRIVSEDCQGDYATYPPGAPYFRAFQGQCVCYMSRMLCVRPTNHTITKGVWLFMTYSAEEEEMLAPYTNLTIQNDVVNRMQRLPYPLKQFEPCFFHLDFCDSDYVVLRSDEFEFDNSTGETGSDGTRLNEEYCDKFFRWIVNEVTDRRSTRQDLLLSIVKLAEVEWDKRTYSSAQTLIRQINIFLILLCTALSLLFRDMTLAFR